MSKLLLVYLAAGLLAVAAAGAAACARETFDSAVEQARSSAEAARIEEAGAIREAQERRRAELEARLEDVRKWTAAQFELANRNVINKPQAMSSLLVKWHSANENRIHALLEFPEKNRGAIESGVALNKLLERIGPAAAQNAQVRLLDSDNALPLHPSTKANQITEEMFNRLTIQDAVTGTKSDWRGNGGPIDLTWPDVLRDGRWAEHRNSIERTRKEALEELAATQGLTAECSESLRNAVAELNQAYEGFRKTRSSELRGTPVASYEFGRLWEGRQFLRRLISSVYFVANADRYYDLDRPKFSGGNAEELLAFLHANSLRFGRPGKSTDRRTYHQVFNMLVRYYLDQVAAVQIEKQLEEETDRSNEISQEAIEVALGQRLTKSEEAAIYIQELKLFKELLDDD